MGLTEPAAAPARPQEPRPPWPYADESVRFLGATRGVLLAGTLTFPKSAKPRGAVVLLSGSGAHDRDESVAGHRPFLVLADHLTRAGFAVLRWDDRGVGESAGDYLRSSAGELVGDAIQAADWLRERFPATPLFLIGHSQGTIVAARVASRRPDTVAGVVLLAGGGRPGREVLIDQHQRIARLEGMDDETIAVSVEVKHLVFDLLSEASERMVLGSEPGALVTDLRARLVELFTKKDGIESLSPAERQELDEVVDDLLEWEWRFLLEVDPAKDLAAVRAPVLALAGDRDCQISPEEDLAAIERALREAGNERVEVEVLRGLNHLFQRCGTGATSEYASLEQTWAPNALRRVSGWLESIRAAD